MKRTLGFDTRALPKLRPAGPGSAGRLVAGASEQCLCLLLNPFVTVGFLASLLLLALAVLTDQVLAPVAYDRWSTPPFIHETYDAARRAIRYGWLVLAAGLFGGKMLGWLIGSRPSLWRQFGWIWPLTLFSYITLIGIIVIMRFLPMFIIHHGIR